MTQPEDIHPFEVFFDAESGQNYIFAPEGCVLVGGKSAYIEGADSYGNVALSGSELPSAVYAHVTKSGAHSGYTHKVEFDEYATKSGAEYDFKVTSLGAADNDGEQYDLATSVVCLGGGKPVPGNFEPVFADDNGTVKLSSVGEGYWPFGRVFTWMVPIVDPTSAKIATGLIYLEVTHPSAGSGSSGSASATVKGGQSLPAPTDAKSYIPLYRIENGEMAVDYRSCMSLPMREL